MKKSSLTLIFALALCGSALAEESAYVSNDLAISLLKTADANAPVIRGLKSGTKFTVIKKDDGNGLAHIRLDDGTEGWIRSRLISSKPGLQQQLAEAQSTIDKLRAELQRAQNQTSPSTSDNSAALAEENSALKARIAQLESEPPEQRKPQQSRLAGALKEMSERDWLLTGSGIMVLGIVIGLIVPRLRWRKRSEWIDL